MEPVYELNLRDYWTIFLKRRWEFLIAFLVIFFSIFIYTSLQQPLYRAVVLLKVEPPALTIDTILPFRIYGMRQFELSDYARQIVSRPVLELSAEELGWIKGQMSQKEKETLLSQLNSQVSAAEIEKSYMIRLSVQSEDPDKATILANKIAEVFKRLNAEQKNEQARNVRIFIENTLNDVSAKLKEQDEKLRLLTTQGAVGKGVNIVDQISELERRRAELSTRFTDKHPNILSIDEEIANLKAELQKLPKEEFEYSILKRDIAINERLYNSLKEQLQAAQIKEAEKIDNVFIVNPAVSARKPFYPNKTRNYLLGIVLGLVFAISVTLVSEHLDTSIGRVEDIENFIKVSVIGIIPYCSELVAEKERRKRRGLFKKERKKIEAIEPAFILKLEKSESTSLFLEAFRLLGVNLQVLFGKSERLKNKLIMLTSCKPEEGKTIIVSALGMIMAQMGYKVLIIDADSRRAYIHKTFGLKKKEDGLTDILSGRITPDSAIRTTTDIMLGQSSIDKVIERPWLNNLNLITAGTTFPNTISLFNSPKLDEVLNYFKNKYDLVLIDTSPILAVSEPSILLPKVDGILLVYRAGSTSRLALRRAKIHIEGIKGKGSLSGIILNNVTPEIGIDTYYYYSKKYYHQPDIKKK